MKPDRSDGRPMMTFRKGNVFVKDEHCGIIEETEDGYRFTYYETYIAAPGARPVSVTMPVQQQPYTSPTLFPFFDGLIPEGWILDVVVKNWKIDPRDRMGLLLTVCRDCIGSVSIEVCDE